MSIQPGTPLPWVTDRIYSDDGAQVLEIRNGVFDVVVGEYSTSDEDAAYIVHACNLYPELLESLQKWLAYDNIDEADFAEVGPMLLYAEAINATRDVIEKATTS